MAAADARTRTEWTGAQLDALAEALLPAAGGTHMPGPATVATGRRALDILAGLPASLRRLVGMELRVLDRVRRRSRPPSARSPASCSPWNAHSRRPGACRCAPTPTSGLGSTRRSTP